MLYCISYDGVFHRSDTSYYEVDASKHGCPVMLATTGVVRLLPVCGRAYVL